MNTDLTPREILLRISRIDVQIAQMNSQRARLDAAIRERQEAKHRLKSQLVLSSVESLSRTG